MISGRTVFGREFCHPRMKFDKIAPFVRPSVRLSSEHLLNCRYNFNETLLGGGGTRSAFQF
jgi:hypothetical protein